MESGTALCPWAVDPPSVAHQRGLVLAERVGCRPGTTGDNTAGAGVDSDLLRCLHDADPVLLSTEQWNVRDHGSALLTPLVATIDNYFLNEMPRQTVAREGFKKESILLGVNHDEGTFFLAYGHQKQFYDAANESMTERDFVAVVREILNADKCVFVAFVLTYIVQLYVISHKMVYCCILIKLQEGQNIWRHTGTKTAKLTLRIGQGQI